MIAALDIGTTSVRCFIISEDYQIKGSAIQTVDLLNPKPGYYEIAPNDLWRQIKHVIVHAIRDAQLSPSDIKRLGVCCQRGTFLTWNHKTKEYYHNFITWKDLRADALVEQWNAGYILRALNAFSYVLYLVTRSKRFLAGSVIKMMNGQVTLRLLFELQNNARLQTALKQNKVRLELLDSWVLYKLRTGDGSDGVEAEHISDVTSCTATGIYDPFTLGWSPLVKLFGIDTNMLPTVVDNNYRNFGHLNGNGFVDVGGAEWADVSIPIACSISDQTASIWGSQCFQQGDVKVTCGTGAFLNFITGRECHASLMGLYPLVAWQFRSPKVGKNPSTHMQTTYCVEAAAYDMGTVMQWAQNCGLFEDVSTTAQLAESVESTNGVFFVPAFSGLGPPINDNKATSGFIGLTPSTTKAHLVRAILESIAFRLVQLCETVEKETDYQLQIIKIDGGVSRNSFVCQVLADTSGIAVERAQNSESSIMGVAYMCNYVTQGQRSGRFEQSLRKYRKVDRIFKPRPEYQEPLRRCMQQWEQAVGRFGQWY